MLCIGSSQSPRMGQTVIEEHTHLNSDSYGPKALEKGHQACFRKPLAYSLALYLYRELQN